MKNTLLIMLVMFFGVISTAVIAGDNDDATNKAVQTVESDEQVRDPFQLPESVKNKGLAAELNKLQPAAGTVQQEEEQPTGYIRGF